MLGREKEEEAGATPEGVCFAGQYTDEVWCLLHGESVVCFVCEMEMGEFLSP